MEKNEKVRESLRRKLDTLNKKLNEKMDEVAISSQQAKIFYYSQEWESAATEYVQLNEYNRTDYELYLEQGVTFGKLNRFEEALTSLYSGLMIDPNNKAIHQVLADYYSLSRTRIPAFALIHLTRFLGKEGESKDKERVKAYEELNRRYSFQKRIPLIGPLTLEENREISILYENNPFKVSSQ